MLLSRGARSGRQQYLQWITKWLSLFGADHEEWLVAVKPELGSNTSVRVQAALDTSLHLVPLVQKVRDEAQFAINELLKVNVS